MRKVTALVLWAYLSEVILAILIVALGCVTLGFNTVVMLVHKFAVDFATLYCAVFFAAALGFLWTFYSKVDTDFYAWLDERKYFQVYLSSILYVLLVEGAAIFFLLATKLFTGPIFSIIAAFVFFMAIVNSYTMVKNVIGLMKLHTLFNKNLRQNRNLFP